MKTFKHQAILLALLTAVTGLVLQNTCLAGQIDPLTGARMLTRPAEDASATGDDTSQQGRQALAAFKDLLRAFETGDTSQVSRRLDPSMIGYQQLLSNVAQQSNECMQMQVHLFNTQVHAQADLAVIQTNWEKRCIPSSSSSIPQFASGRTTAVMNPGPNGWTFSAISVGNMFERPLATASLTTPTTCTVSGRIVAYATVRSVAQCTRRGGVLACP